MLEMECREANHTRPSPSGSFRSTLPPMHAHSSPDAESVHCGSVWFIESNQNCTEVSSPVVMNTFKTITLDTDTCSEAKLSHEEQTFSSHSLPVPSNVS